MNISFQTIKRQRDYNFKHFRYRNFGIVPEWFIIKFQARNDYWPYPWSFRKSVLLVFSHLKASHPQIWEIFWKWKTLFFSSYCWMITVIFHVTYTYLSSKFLVWGIFGKSNSLCGKKSTNLFLCDVSKNYQSVQVNSVWQKYPGS